MRAVYFLIKKAKVLNAYKSYKSYKSYKATAKNQKYVVMQIQRLD